MNCILQALPTPPPRFGIAPGQSWGLDFGWSGVSAALAKANGATFGASYFSADASKNWTKALVDSYHAAGLKTVGVWETTATRATQGYAAGQADARSAKAQAAAVGNTNRPIDFAIDCECTGPSVLPYFQGAHSILGNRTNAYGDYDALLYLSQHGAVGTENWQTYAWSGGRWLPNTIAPLEQYLNGAAFDHDRANAAAYGQWPYSPSKPQPQTLTQKLSLTRLDATVRHFGKDHAQERNTALSYLKAGCVRTKSGKHKGQYIRSVCKSSSNHLLKLHNRLVSLHKHGRAWSQPKKPSASGPRNQVLWHLYLGHRKTWSSWSQMVKG